MGVLPEDREEMKNWEWWYGHGCCPVSSDRQESRLSLDIAPCSVLPTLLAWWQLLEVSRQMMHKKINLFRVCLQTPNPLKVFSLLAGYGSCSRKMLYVWNTPSWRLLSLDEMCFEAQFPQLKPGDYYGLSCDPIHMLKPYLPIPPNGTIFGYRAIKWYLH
jgi:hypothetical protein